MPLPLATGSKVLTCASTGQSITLVKQLADSGEGEVWRTNIAGYLAKLYHDLDLNKIRKLEVMIANPPKDPNAHIRHTSFAWPKSLLKDERGQTIGFLMPQIVDSVEIIDVYNPRRRQAIVPGFNWLYLHATAVNVASIISAIHRAGYVLGDIKPQNILVNNQALASIIDTDSFQVKDPDSKAIYRCPVGSEGFTPPELLDRDLGATDQTEIHDRFRLGVIIYLLLFGDHPFKGKWAGKGDSPEPHELLKQGYWPYGVNSLIHPGPLTIPLETVHPELQKCFQRCFTDGHAHPELRPSAQKWFSTLQLALNELKLCRKNPRHYHSVSYGKCYWCDRQRVLGVDIFPKELNWLETKSKNFSNRFKSTPKKTNVKATKLQKRQKPTQPARKSPPQAAVPAPKLQQKTKSTPKQLVPYAQGVGQLNSFSPFKSLIDRRLLIWGLASVFALSSLGIALFNVVGDVEMNDLQWGSTSFAIAIGLGLFGMAGLLLKWTKS